MEFAALVPEFYVSDYERSLKFYTETIGFKIEFQRTNPKFAYLSFGDAQIMLQQLEDTDVDFIDMPYPYGRGANFEIDTPDVDALANEIKADGFKLMLEPTNFYRETGDTNTGSRELRVLDPDGYYLRFSSEIPNS